MGAPPDRHARQGGRADPLGAGRRWGLPKRDTGAVSVFRQKHDASGFKRSANRRHGSRAQRFAPFKARDRVRRNTGKRGKFADPKTQSGAGHFALCDVQLLALLRFVLTLLSVPNILTMF